MDNFEHEAFPSQETPTIDEGNVSEPTVIAEEPSVEADTAVETKTDESTDENIVADNPVEGEKVSKESTEIKEEEASDKTAEQLLEEVDKEIANEKNSAYYRNGLKVFKQNFLEKTEAVTKTYEPLQDYGDVSTITENLEIIKGLESFAVNPQTNLPDPTVRPFVDRLIEKNGIYSFDWLIKTDKCLMIDKANA